MNYNYKVDRQMMKIQFYHLQFFSSGFGGKKID